MRTKKLTALCLCAAVVLSVSACGGRTDPPAGTTATTTALTTTTPAATLKEEDKAAIAEIDKESENEKNRSTVQSLPFYHRVNWN